MTVLHDREVMLIILVKVYTHVRPIGLVLEFLHAHTLKRTNQGPALYQVLLTTASKTLNSSFIQNIQCYSF